uniref:SAM domain-containing protein n=1 Tax=Strigamia maritima TaxID=126957 RepID=T1JGA4_STRMM
MDELTFSEIELDLKEVKTEPIIDVSGKIPADRTCAQICINYEPTSRHLSLAASRSTGRPGVPHLARPPDNDEEDSRVPRAVFWDSAQVGLWITSIGFPQYKQCLEANHITGLQLILLNGNSLPQMGITINNHIKIILKNVHQLLGITADNSRKSIVARPREEIGIIIILRSISNI